MNAKLEIQINITLTGKRFWILRNGQRVDARTLGYTKAWFKTCQEASDAIEAL
jgi:hypothetical protein